MGIPFPLPVEDRSRLRLRTISSQTNVIVLDAFIKRRGERTPRQLEILNLTPDGDRGVDIAEEFIPGGELWGVSARERLGTLERGQTYCRIDLIPPSGGATLLNLARGYVHRENILSGGEFEDSLSGKGHLSWRTVADDVTPVSITQALAIANARLKVYGFVWYYNCAVEAVTRVLRALYRNPGPSVPTGFDTISIVAKPHSADLSLTTGQEGILYAYNSGRGDGYASRNDNTALSVENTTTVAQIFPLEIMEDDLAELRFTVVDAHADDRHSIFILQEEWI